AYPAMWRRLLRHALAFLDGLDRQADAALLVDFQHLDLDHVAFLELVGDPLHALAGDLRDVHQAVLARQDGHERTEVHDLGDLALVDPARLHVRGDLLDTGLGGLAGGTVDRGDGDGAIVLDIDLGAGLLGDGLDHRTALADHFADLVGVDLDGDQARRELAQFLARRGHRVGHLAEDVQSASLRLRQRLLHDLFGDPLDLDA